MGVDVSNPGAKREDLEAAVASLLGKRLLPQLKAPDADFDKAPWRLVRGDSGKAMSTLSWEDPITEGATYYIGLNGSDSNLGTYSSPFHSWAKAISQPDVGRVCWLGEGRFYRQKGLEGGAWPADGRPISLVSATGRPVLSTADNPSTMSWSAVGGYPNVYRVAVANCSGVGDYGFADSEGFPERYASYASVDLLSAASYGYFYDNTHAYVKTRDGTSPDLDVTVFRTLGMPGRSAGGTFLRGLDFHGYRMGLTFNASAYNPDMWLMMDSCRVGLAWDSNVVGAADIRWAALRNCVGAYGKLDVFNWHKYDSSAKGQPMNILEENCRGYWSGMTAINGSDQISTIHEDIIIQRVGCNYHSSGGQVIKDQGEASPVDGGYRTKTWILDSELRDSRSTGTYDRGLDIQAGQCWVENTYVHGNATDVVRSVAGDIWARGLRGGVIATLSGTY